MKCIIAGSREITDYSIVKKIMDSVIKKYEITEVVSGTARGVDTLGEQWARDNNIPVKSFPANWKPDGKHVDMGAGVKRNKKMGDYADMAVVIHRNTNGSLDMIKYMKKVNKPCIDILCSVLDNSSDLFNNFA